MKYLFSLLLIVFLQEDCSVAKEIPLPATYTTEYFSFQNDYWINLHHFLYQKAKGSQLKKLEEDGNAFMAIGEEAVYESLNSEELKKLDDALLYYKNNLITQDLRRELGRLRVWLQALDHDGMVTDTTFSQAYTDIMNSASEVYRTKFWPIHRAHNERTLSKHLALIIQFEAGVIAKMERLSQYQWPTEEKVRVDVTTYANWAGAYTPTRPNLNIIISTIDELNTTSAFIETIFHEGSHLLFRMNDSPFREAIYQHSEEMELEFPRNLWHASLFYLCGRATQDQLKTKGVDHQLVMDELNVFTSYNTPEFRAALEKYYQGEQGMEATIRSLLTAIKGKTN